MFFFKKYKNILILILITFFGPSYGGERYTIGNLIKSVITFFKEKRESLTFDPLRVILPDPENFVKRVDLGFVSFWVVTELEFMEHCKKHKCTPLGLQIYYGDDTGIRVLSSSRVLSSADATHYRDSFGVTSSENNSYKFIEGVLPNRPQLLLFQGSYNQFLKLFVKEITKNKEADYPKNRFFVDRYTYKEDDSFLLELLKRYPIAQERFLSSEAQLNKDLFNVRVLRLGKFSKVMPAQVCNLIIGFLNPFSSRHKYELDNTHSKVDAVLRFREERMREINHQNNGFLAYDRAFCLKNENTLKEALKQIDCKYLT